MVEVPSFRRRTFLIGSALLGGSTILNVAGLSGCVDPDPELPTSVGKLALGVADSRPVREIGLRYLRQHPEESDLPWLESATFPDLSPDVLPSPDEIARRFRNLVRRDFEVGDVLRLDGWLLAKSELRLCAIAALISRTAASDVRAG